MCGDWTRWENSNGVALSKNQYGSRVTLLFFQWENVIRWRGSYSTELLFQRFGNSEGAWRALQVFQSFDCASQSWRLYLHPSLLVVPDIDVDSQETGGLDSWANGGLQFLSVKNEHFCWLLVWGALVMAWKYVRWYWARPIKLIQTQYYFRP